MSKAIYRKFTSWTIILVMAILSCCSSVLAAIVDVEFKDSGFDPLVWEHNNAGTIAKTDAGGREDVLQFYGGGSGKYKCMACNEDMV